MAPAAHARAKDEPRHGVIAVALAAGLVCLAAGDQRATFAADRFTLVWRHSIEKIDWEEDYVVAGRWLYLSGARIRGTGAGMEMPPDAQRVGNVYVFRPAQRWTRMLDLARSEFVQDYRLCIGGSCEPMGKWIPVSAGVTHVEACSEVSHPARGGSKAGLTPSPAAPSRAGPGTPGRSRQAPRS